MDNVFCFVMLFSYFNVPPELQHPVLFWGVLGALIMRGVLIAVGSALIARFHWVIYIFGAFLVFTGARMALHEDEGIHPERNPVLNWARKLLPITEDYQHDHFFVRNQGVLMATPLFLVLLLVETTDLMFAVDSIPAVFAITRDPFIVLTSNVMAILGLRTLYFLLAGVIDLFHYLKVGLAIVLVFVGFKMLLSELYHIPITISLGMVAGILVLSIVLSLLFPEGEAEQEEEL
jgi:tellurite resistance protein TerC